MKNEKTNGKRKAQSQLETDQKMTEKKTKPRKNLVWGMFVGRPI
jgi:hypothetical protein